MAVPRDYHKRGRPEVAKFLPATYANVLEIGCGEGAFRANLARKCNYVGIEPLSAAASVAMEVLDEVHVGTFDQVAASLPRRHFDLVICNDVIEHMIDHDAFFESIKVHMTPHANLVGSIPNVRYLPNLINLLISKNWKYTNEGILDRTHLRFFTEKSLRESLESHGYQIASFAGINSLTLERTSIKRFAKSLLISVFGEDTRHLQFGFRASLAWSSGSATT